MNWSSEAVRVKTGRGGSSTCTRICLIFKYLSHFLHLQALFSPPSQLRGDGAPEVTARRPPKFCGWRLA